MNTTTTAAAVMIERKPLADALALAMRVVEARNTIPILSCILIEATDAGARIFATDLDCQISVDVPAAWDAPGAFVVDGKAFADAVKACDGGDIMLREETAPAGPSSGRVSIVSGRARFSVEARTVSDMPRIRRGDAAPVRLDMGAAALRAVMLDGGRFVSTEETRYYLNGISIQADAGDVVAVSTHGHGMFARRLGMPADAAAVEAFERTGVIIPRKACALVGRMIRRDADDSAALTLLRGSSGAPLIEMQHGAATIRTKAIDGTFPDWHRVVPGDDVAGTLAGVWTVQAGELGAFAKSAAAGQRKATAALRFDPGAIRACTMIEGSAAHSAAPGAYIGDGTLSGAALHYLADAAATFDPAAVVDVAVYPMPADRHANRCVPFVLTSATAPGDVVLVMPNAAEWREPVAAAVLPPAPIAAPGQAAPLFDIIAGQAMAIDPATGRPGGTFANGIGPRLAQPVEIAAYLRDYATRCGLPAFEAVALHGGTASPCQGATFGHVVDGPRRETLRAWCDTAGDVVESIMERPAQYQPGAYSVPMPGYRQGPVIVEELDEAGAVISAAVVPVDAKGAIGLGAAAVAAMSGLAPVKAPRATKRDTAAAKRAAGARPAADAARAAALVEARRVEMVEEARAAPRSPLADKAPGHYAAGAAAHDRGERRELPSYFTTTRGNNPRAWFAGWDAAARAALIAEADGTVAPVVDYSAPAAADAVQAAPVESETADAVAADTAAAVDYSTADPAPAIPAVEAPAVGQDVAALVEALAARVAALEARAPVTAAGPVRAPRAVRERLVRAYLRQRAARAADRAALVEARRDVERATIAADNANERAAAAVEELGTAMASLDRTIARRRATAAWLVKAHRAAARHRADAFQAGRRAHAAETALAGAQLASAAAWERVAALQLDRDGGTAAAVRLAVAA